MMTGNTLSIVANRLSYALDLNGPSFTVDTACSSSLVALSLAAEAIRNGTVETAIVGGVNLLLSPFSFVGFSRASMLSPTGLCRPFDAAADGYVRAEGVIVLVLRALSIARKAHNRVHAAIIGSAVGQDGRTTGLSLPSAMAQRRLLEQVYNEFAVDPSDLSFVEAHGTGTKVGDPLEADALGKGLAQKRRQPLGIGSVKSNIGHLEPASGLAGMLKSMLALRHGAVPATLHQRQPNPDIPFDDLNLRVIDRLHRLPGRRGPHLCGVNSFGFGGTNAHVVLRDDDVSVSTVQVRHDRSTPPLLLSAHSAEALPELAAAHAKHWPADRRACLDWIAAAAHLRDALPHRVLIHGETCEQLKAHVQAYATGQAPASAITARALGDNLPVAFLLSGNGAQWAGMGQSAWQADERFREALRSIDERFQRREKWSLVETLFDAELAAKLRRATYAQPLILALQMATVWVLEESGLSCSAALGHSVGEIAAAWAAGHLSVEQALDIVIARSRHQEQVRGQGTMAALMLGEREARRLLENAGVPGTDIAAVNSWRSVTVSGPSAEIEQLLDLAVEGRVSARKLDLDYPFHSALTDPVRAPLLRDLNGLRPLGGHKRFVSSVTGQAIGADQLGPDHWWHNVREPVRFEAGLSCLIEEGYRVFVEVGAKPILGAYVRDALRRTDERGAIIETLTDVPVQETSRPLDRTVSKVLLAGGQVDCTRFFGAAPLSVPELPLYPWRHTQYRVKPTPEAASTFAVPANTLLGARLLADACEWRSTVDPVLFPWIADHKVGGVALFPATAFVEVLLAAARQAVGDDPIELRDLDILRPLVFDGHISYETSVRLASETGLIEFRSRPRGSTEWAMHARGVIGRSPVADKAPKPLVPPPGTVIVAKPKVYEVSAELGFGYGPSFQRTRHVAVFDDTCAVATLEAPSSSMGARAQAGSMLDIAGFDAAFHSLFASEEAGVADRPMSRMVPVRFAQVRLFKTGVAVAYVVARTVRRSQTSILIDIDLLDSDGQIVLAAEGVRLIDAPAEGALDAAALSYRMSVWQLDRAGVASPLSLTPARLASLAEEDARKGEATAEALLLLEAGALRIAWQALSRAVEEAAEDGEEEFAGEHEGPAWPSFLKGALLWHLETKGLVQEQDGERRFALSCDLPEVGLLTRSLLVRHPTMVDEAAELAHLQDVLPRLISSLPDASALESVHWRRLAAGANQIALLERAVLANVTACLEAAEPGRPFGSARGRLLRLLLAGADHLQLVKDLASRFACLEIIVTDLDGVRLESARAALGEEWPSVRCMGWHELETLEAASLDLACFVDGLCRIAAVRGGLVHLLSLLRPRAPLVAGELAPSVFWDIVRGTSAAWWARSANVAFPVSVLLTGQEWADELLATGFAGVDVKPLLGQEQVGVVIHALAASVAKAQGDPAPLKWEGDRPSDAESVLGQLLLRVPDCLPDGEPQHVVWAIDARNEAAIDLVSLTEQLAKRLAAFRAAKAKLWVLIELARGDGALETPLWTALAAALRVAQNEHPSRDIRCLGMSGDVPVEHLLEELCAPSAEGEIFFEDRRRVVFRVERGIVAARPARPRRDEALQLSVPAGAARGALGWSIVPRTEPGPGEVEIEVATTGLNFRDVMWNLRVLPEEALEDGYVGPRLGMECAGTVVRVGEGVSSFAAGDRIVAFVPGAFASHVIAPTYAVCSLPQQLSFEAAATIPVAFLTAYYSLVRLAHLQKGETVLVHGGAGAVGLAALQIAKHVGAKVIATAGTEEKRALLNHLGADAVFNSRTPAFADEVLAFGEGKGVDVVLNSLAGEAMIRSMDCLRPFGRFIELGKRDFYGNTHLGLRPFRRNLSYFGVDVDQLIGEHRALTRAMFSELLELFASGELSPLPHREFRGPHIEDAFRLMQRSGHIGKILVRPAERATADTRQVGRFPVDPEGLHVVFGGTSGFGLATAAWLVRRGARHLVLASRSGRVAPSAKAELEAMRDLGADILVKPIDITDQAALEAFLIAAAVRRPIKGIVHAAMVLDDRLIDGMDREVLEKVLRPKVTGALNLDRLTRGHKLDYLLLYSSATTLLGNPGQYNYVVANAFLEGLARRRVAEGLPALAVAWGAIEDVGYLAHNLESSPSLKKRFSSSLLLASQALDGLDWAYDAEARARTAFCSIARIDWGMARRDLALSKRPLLASVLPAAGARQAIEATALLEKLRAMPLEQATAALLDILVEEIARVLRLAPKEVHRHRSLGEIGMDSLMMLELRTTVEAALQIELPLLSVANGITPADVARRIVPLVLGDKQKEAIPSTLLALGASHIAEEIAQSDTTGRTAAARAVLERSRAMEGPL
jgi:acyl transferase domain-containing protein/NADPH:quinone reductase-like Zn-dependent oxidoreductase